MKIFGKKIVTVFSFSLFFINGCSKIETGNQNQNQAAREVNQTANSNLPPVKDDLEDLGKIIKLPAAPEEAVWRDDPKKLIAVIKFTDADADAIARRAESYNAAAPSDIDAENWFPAELIAQSQLSGDETLKGVQFAANDFLQQPYSQGKVTRIDNTGYFVLELNAP